MFLPNNNGNNAPDPNDGIRLVWTDVETGDLDENKGILLEIAVIVTDVNLREIGTPFHEIIRHSQEDLDGMSEWSRDKHGKSGLTAMSLQSDKSLTDVEDLLFKHLSAMGVEQYNFKERTGPVIAGNNVGFDQRWVNKHLPKIGKLLHYRNFDISVINVASRMWAPTLAEKVVKKYEHRAIDDIRESIEEARIYRKGLRTLDVTLVNKLKA